ncbi:MAG: toxic anion resistance protein, partial [Clostridiales bacterium]|nr:toxic anion resistance protein [Clostridiales bacterium]
SERGIVDIETLTATNQTLISTLDEVLKIQEDGKQKRAAAEVELQRIENEMKTKLQEFSAR